MRHYLMKLRKHELADQPCLVAVLATLFAFLEFLQGHVLKFLVLPGKCVGRIYGNEASSRTCGGSYRAQLQQIRLDGCVYSFLAIKHSRETAI